MTNGRGKWVSWEEKCVAVCVLDARQGVFFGPSASNASAKLWWIARWSVCSASVWMATVYSLFTLQQAVRPIVFNSRAGAHGLEVFSKADERDGD